MSTNMLQLPELQPAQGTGSVPSSASPNASSNAAHIANLIREASTPVLGAHAGNMPTSLQTPITPFQPAQTNHTPVVGRKNARAQGIGNAIIGVGNALGAVTTAVAQQKQGQIRDAAEKVLQSQQGIDQAQQAHDMAVESLKNAEPGSPEAKTYQDQVAKAQQAIDQNKKTRDGIFADPKMQKALVKGFNISHTDPSQNNTEEHQAVMQAMKNVQSAAAAKDKQGLAQAQQQLQQARGAEAGSMYAKQQPQGQSPNTQAQAQLAAQQAQQKLQQEAQKNFNTFRASMAGHQATVTAAQMRVQAQLLQQQATFAHQQSMLDQRFQQANQLFEKHKNLEFSLIGAREKAARELANDVYSDKETNPLTMYTKINASVLKYQDNLEKNQNTLISSIQKRQKQYPDGAGKGEAAKDPEGYQALNYQIAMTQQQIKQDQRMIDNLQKQSQIIKQAVGIGNEGSSNNGGSTGSTDGNSVGSGSADYTDFNNYLNPGPGEEDDTPPDPDSK